MSRNRSYAPIIGVRLDDETLRQVGLWMHKEGVKNRAEAIRSLIKIGLDSHTPALKNDWVDAVTEMAEIIIHSPEDESMRIQLDHFIIGLNKK
ncbi:MAG: hypothetical protein ABIH11_07825 [Candidatus Altiarchaeota archaeon]